MPRRLKPIQFMWVLLVSCLFGCSQDDVIPVYKFEEGAQYVAMGSSFASGPGITSSADSPPNRCSRSIDNYSNILARKRGLKLIDVSCSGATTAHLLGAWNDFPAQLDAVTAETALVTITIGGNDVNYIGGLFTSSQDLPPKGAWARLQKNLEQIAREVRSRAANARLVFVDYVTLLPIGKLCEQIPISQEAAATARLIAERLANVTATAARRANADIIRVSELSRSHNVCSKKPWVTGVLVKQGAVPYHPNLAGMRFIAKELDDLLDQ